MFFQKQSFIAVDLETTGVNSETDKIIEFAGVLVENGKVMKQLEFVINPGIPITPQIQAITGISNEEVQGKPAFDEVKNEIQAFVEGHIIVGHNILFDLSFLEKNGVRVTGEYLDTYTLSSLFFPEEKSLALEVLSENLQIEHKYKHRALGDILATVELLKIIHQKIQTIPVEILIKLQSFLENKNTPLKTLFSDVKSVSSSKEIFNLPENKNDLTNLQNSKITETLQGVLHSTENTILEIPHQYNTILELIKNLQGKNTVAFYSPKLINKVLHFLNKSSKDNFCVLKNAHNYLCLPKFEKFLYKPNLNDTEIALALKIMIWLATTQSGDRDEIALTYDDYTIWYNELCSNDSCSGAEHSNCFWQKQKKKAQESDLIFTYQNLLLENDLPTDHNLILCEARDLEKALTSFGSHKLALEDFANILTPLQVFTESIDLKNKIKDILENLQLIWGYLHRELTQNLEEFIYPQKIIFDNKLKTHTGFLEIRKRFKEIFIDLNLLLESIENLNTQKFRINQLKNLSQDLQTFFDEWHENEIRFFQAFPAGELEIQIDTIDLKPLSSEIFAKYQRVICLDENLGTVNGENEYTFDYWKKSLGVDDLNWQDVFLTREKSQKAKVDLAFLLSKPSSQNLFERTCDLIKETVISNQGRTLVLFTSYANINLYLEKLGLELQDLGYKVLPQGGGGVKKLKTIFEQFPEKSVIFGIERSFHREFFNSQDLKTVILHKVVFDFPGDPLIQARQEKYANNFMDFSLPRSILSFKQSYLKLQSEEQVFLPLDNRLTDKQYGKYFLQSLERS